MTRRGAASAGLAAGLALAAGLPLGGAAAPALAVEAGYEMFYGAANPPGTYGRSARCAPAQARYEYEYPEGWEEESVNKIEKGTSGTDSRVKGTGGLEIYVTSLTRLGEDKGFSLNPKFIERTLQGLAISNYKLQDALGSGTLTSSTREVGDQLFIDVMIDYDTTFYGTLTNDGAGRFYALWCVAPKRRFNAKKATFDHAIETFKTHVI